MSAGDLLLFHRPITPAAFRRDPFGTAMCALIHLTTRSRYNHAALVLDEKLNYAEATSAGVLITRWGTTTDDVVKIPVRYDDEDDRLTAVAWAHARAGVRYGYGNAFMCGLNSVLAGLGLVIKRTDSIICSELVAESLTRAGYDFKKDCSLVSPGDLASYFGEPR